MPASNLPYVQRFIYQQAYKNITVGIAPWWPSKRGSTMVLDRAGTDRQSGKGFQMIPKDTSIDPDYSRWVENYGRAPPDGMGMTWEEIQTYPSKGKILGKASDESTKLGEMLNRMLDFEFGSPTQSAFGTAIENEIKNLAIINQMPEDMAQIFMGAGELVPKHGSLGHSNTMDHIRNSWEGIAAINVLAQAIGGDVGAAMKQTAYGVDTTDSVASKWLTRDHRTMMDMPEGALESIKQSMLQKLNLLNKQFDKVGKAMDWQADKISEMFKNTPYAGKTTVKGGYTTMEGFGKHVHAILLGIAKQHAGVGSGALSESQMSYNSLSFVEPIGRSGYAAFVVLAPQKGWNGKGTLQLTAQIDFASIGVSGVAATSSHLMANALSQYASSEFNRTEVYSMLNQVAVSTIAVQTDARHAAIGSSMDVGLGEMVDMGTTPMVATQMTMQPQQVADSLHMQIENWAHSPDNRKRFEKWYKEARLKSERLYHTWRDKHVILGNAQPAAQGGHNPTIWRQDQGISMDIRTHEMAPSDKPGQQFEISREDYGIWNERNEGQNIGGPSGRDALGIHISPFLVSRNKFISKFGRT